MSHTKEPWETFSAPFEIGVRKRWGEGVEVTALTYWSHGNVPPGEREEQACNANATRIVACVNACAGLPDPKENIKGLAQTARHFQAMLKDAIKSVELEQLHHPAITRVLAKERERELEMLRLRLEICEKTLAPLKKKK